MPVETVNLGAQENASLELRKPVPVAERTKANSWGHGERRAIKGFEFEILESNELALRLKVKESWVVEQSTRSRTSDPIPVFRLGKHRRYRWGSPEMNDWLARRAGTTTQRKIWS